MKVLAFIVTYNRLSSLQRVIACVQNQTYDIDEIIVVNNDSTDGTTEWLATVDGISIIHQENVGGAGGFHTGVKVCYERGADWIWMMDDDVFPQEDCLENLLRYKDDSKCLNMTRYWADGGYVPQNFFFDISRNYSKELGADLSKEYVELNTCCFEGLLVAREIVDKIGFPDKRFFIAGDDTIYGYLASMHTKVILVRDARANKLQNKDSIKPRPFYTYYFVRNYFLINEYKKIYHGSGYSILVWVRYCTMVLGSTFKNILLGKFDLAKSVMRGALDGLANKVGKTY